VDSGFVVDGTPLPDARLDLWARRKRTECVYLGMVYEQVFCVNCGRAGGGVPKGATVFFLCDACVAKHGPPPGAIEVKPDAF
jgi:hypothetical protein